MTGARASAAAPPVSRLRVVSYNVHACVGTDGVFAPERIAAVLRGLAPDIVALQEVEDRTVDGARVSGWLARQLALEPLRGTTLRRADADYGNLLLTRFPATQNRRHDLSVPGREPRGAIEVDLAIDGARVRCIASHFGLHHRERLEQLRRLVPRLARGGADLRILCADLNEWFAWSPVHRVLARHLGRTAAPRSFPSRIPIFALDRIYVSPSSQVRRIRVVDDRDARIASDHLPVVADIELPTPAERPERLAARYDRGPGPWRQ